MTVSLGDRIRHNILFRFVSALFFVGVGVVVAILVQRVIRQAGLYDTVGGRLIFTAVWVAALGLSYAAYVRIVEQRAVVEFKLTRLPSELALGIALGGSLVALQVLLLWLFGVYSVAGMAASKDVAMLLMISVITGFSEELLNKGILFQLAEEKLGSWIAAVIVALEVGLTHMTNEGATLISTIAVSLEFGIFLALLFVVTRRLWTVIGFHFAWNFTMGGIFGITVSGMKLNGLMQSQLTGSALLTGGVFGIEAGVLAVAIVIVLIGVLARYLVSNKLIRRRTVLLAGR